MDVEKNNILIRFFINNIKENTVPLEFTRIYALNIPFGSIYNINFYKIT